MMAGDYNKWEEQFRGRLWLYGYTRTEVEELFAGAIEPEEIRTIMGDMSEHKFFIYCDDTMFSKLKTALMLDRQQMHAVGNSSPGLYYMSKQDDSIDLYG